MGERDGVSMTRKRVLKVGIRSIPDMFGIQVAILRRASRCELPIPVGISRGFCGHLIDIGEMWSCLDMSAIRMCKLRTTRLAANML